MILADHDIFRLQIAVHDVPAVCVGKGIADPQKKIQPEPEGLAFVVRADPILPVVLHDSLEITFQVLPVHHFHCQMQTFAVIAVDGVDGQDRGVFQLCRHPCFCDECAALGGIVQVFLPQGFDGDQPPQVPVFSPGDDALTAAGEGFAPFVIVVQFTEKRGFILLLSHIVMTHGALFRPDRFFRIFGMIPEQGKGFREECCSTVDRRGFLLFPLRHKIFQRQFDGLSGEVRGVHLYGFFQFCVLVRHGQVPCLFSFR